MIKIKSKISGKTVEIICNEKDFIIDKNFIYSKDEFGNTINWNRRGFYSEKEIN